MDDTINYTLKGLADLAVFVEEMKSTSKGSKKKEILDKYKSNKFILNALIYANDPYKKYHLTSKNCIKHPELMSMETYCLWDLLDGLSTGALSGHQAIGAVNAFVAYFGYEEIIYSILDKNLKTRANASLVNKIIPNLIPTFDVALAKTFEPSRVDFNTEQWYCSRKLDGVRCIAIYKHDNKSVELYSRVGNKFTTLQVIREEILNLDLIEDTVFDGELCIMDSEGNEDFQSVMKVIKRKDYTIPNPKYIIFDMMTLEDFNSKKSKDILSDRIKYLNEIVINGFSDFLETATQVLVENEDHLLSLKNNALEKGYEGVMIRRNVKYEGKRTFNLMKIKEFKDAEFVVKSIGTGVQRILEEDEHDSENMVEVERDVLSQVVITYKGEDVEVGSGWSQSQRIHYAKHPSELIGKTITVQWFEETTDKNGKVSLRFPTVKIVHGNERCV